MCIAHRKLHSRKQMGAGPDTLKLTNQHGEYPCEYNLLERFNSMGVCTYSSSFAPAKLCGRHILGVSDFCEFHEPIDSVRKLPVHEFLKKLLDEYHKNRQGDWRGFEFPNGIKFENFEIDYAIDLRGAKFRDVTFENVHFRNAIDFSNCKFDGTLTLNATFDGDTNFSDCKFEGRTVFSGNFNDHVSFNGSMFNDAVSFLGGRDVFVAIHDHVEISENIVALLSPADHRYSNSKNAGGDSSKGVGEKIAPISSNLWRRLISLRSILKKRPTPKKNDPPRSKLRGILTSPPPRREG